MMCKCATRETRDQALLKGGMSLKEAGPIAVLGLSGRPGTASRHFQQPLLTRTTQQRDARDY